MTQVQLKDARKHRTQVWKNLVGKTRWALTVIGRNLNPASLPTLEAMCLRQSPRPFNEQVQLFARHMKRKLSRLMAKIAK